MAMKIQNVIWFTQSSGTFGIVYGQDDITKEKKAYIGKVKGEDEEQDINHIKNYGTKLLKGQLNEIYEYLSAE